MVKMLIKITVKKTVLIIIKKNTYLTMKCSVASTSTLAQESYLRASIATKTF
jgi:hypothetical protein